MKAFSTLLVVTFLLYLAPAFADGTLKNRFSDDELVTILKEEGYGATRVLKPGALQVKINGTAYLLFNQPDGDLQTAYAISGVKLGYDDINEWNRTKRLSRAYLDNEMDPVLESDLLANAGMTPQHVTEFFNVFKESAAAFKRFIIEHDGNRK